KKERLAVLGELAGSVAHEIRNPIAVIGNALFLLRRKYKGPDGEPPKEVGLIDQQIQRTNRIVSELLDYAQGSSTLFQCFPLQEAAEEAMGELEMPPTIRVDRRFEDHPVLVEADAGQVQRILRNLLTNGVEAMPEGGTLRLECRRVGDEAVISVIDTGVGISEDDLSQVFEPLFTTKANGIGLGLPLSQRYARLNQGRIECDSLPTRGAIFRLVLPAQGVAEPGRTDTETEPGDPSL
ncbi:MAG: histidine kinase, partial [bacterium]|nr:histidine kinase [bacterium]